MDSYANALEGRKKKLLSIEIKMGDPEKAGLAPEGKMVDPTEEHEDMAMDQEMIDEAKEEGLEGLDEATEETKKEGHEDADQDREMILAAMRGNNSDEQTEEEFEGRAPRSLGERVRLLLAKKK